jgi:polyisoprenoid-binding protein YceI
MKTTALMITNIRGGFTGTNGVVVYGSGGPANSSKRSDFGLTNNAALETGGILIGDDLKLEIAASLIKAGSTSA